MAKKSVSVSFKNATIECKGESILITEYNKDSIEVFDLKAVLDEWNGIDGVSFSLKQENGIDPSELTGGEED